MDAPKEAEHIQCVVPGRAGQRRSSPLREDGVVFQLENPRELLTALPYRHFRITLTHVHAERVRQGVTRPNVEHVDRLVSRYRNCAPREVVLENAFELLR